MEAVITEEFALRVILHGPCRKPSVGKKVSSFTTQELMWAEDRKLMTVDELKAIGIHLPLWVCSYAGYGYGDGYGDGDGDGAGYGAGYGDGDGAGDGAGDGYGAGYGAGYGDGDGAGYGDGLEI